MDLLFQLIDPALQSSLLALSGLSDILHFFPQLSIQLESLCVLLQIPLVALFDFLFGLLPHACLILVLLELHPLFLLRSRLKLALQSLNLRRQVHVFLLQRMDSIALDQKRAGLRPGSNQDVFIHLHLAYLFIIAA